MITTNPPATLRYALAAAARGWHVFPLAVGDKAPPRGFTDWENRATTDPDTIRRWWAREPYNIGIATGPSNLIVIDLDTPKYEKGQKEGLRPPPPWDLPGINEGADVLAVLCERAGEPFPFETFTVRTRRGGTHLYFTPPDCAHLPSTAGALGWLIDTRAHGGYVVGPGSYVNQPDGTGGYEVLHNTHPASLPPCLFKLLVPAPRPPQQPVRLTVAEGRHAAYLNAAIARELEHLAAAPDGQRNRTLYGTATALGQLVAGGALAEQQVTSLLEQAGGGIGLSHAEAARTIASGLRNGAKRPRHLAA